MRVDERVHRLGGKLRCNDWRYLSEELPIVPGLKRIIFIL